MCHTLLSWKGVGWNFRCCEYADRFRWCFPCFWKKRWSPKKQQTKQSKLVSIMGFTSCIMRFTSCLTRTAWTSHLPVGLGVMIQGFYTTLQCESWFIIPRTLYEKSTNIQKTSLRVWSTKTMEKTPSSKPPKLYQNRWKMDVSSAMTGHHLGLESLCSILAVASGASTFTQETPWDFNTWDGLGQGNAGPMDTQKWTRRFFGCVEGCGKVMFLSGHSSSF